MPDTSRTSVIKEIDKNQAAVHEYLFQLDQIETKLRRTNLSDEQRVALEDEVRTVKKQLDSLGHGPSHEQANSMITRMSSP
ncbi:uncharacterized protein LOC8051902 isoform X2 [Ixodes scapularis]|uniref:uncharacterized protein LOC8051902 isoform X2 n=1 Tax=Ixodes scapularis TaxID=6945 RepID=UPI001161C4CF|nr:uncharacterized protein LOC8051902 isoform X2 [Ixodes scapularis]